MLFYDIPINGESQTLFCTLKSDKYIKIEDWLVDHSHTFDISCANDSKTKYYFDKLSYF